MNWIDAAAVKSPEPLSLFRNWGRVTYGEEEMQSVADLLKVLLLINSVSIMAIEMGVANHHSTRP